GSEVRLYGFALRTAGVVEVLAGAGPGDQEGDEKKGKSDESPWGSTVETHDEADHNHREDQQPVGLTKAIDDDVRPATCDHPHPWQGHRARVKDGSRDEARDSDDPRLVRGRPICGRGPQCHCAVEVAGCRYIECVR